MIIKFFVQKQKLLLIKANNSRENWPAGTVINVDGDWSRVGLTLALGNVTMRAGNHWVDIHIDIAGDKTGCLYIYRNYHL